MQMGNAGHAAFQGLPLQTPDSHTEMALNEHPITHEPSKTGNHRETKTSTFIAGTPLALSKFVTGNHSMNAKRARPFGAAIAKVYT